MAKVRFSDIDKVLLDRLRKELGINQSETGSEEDLERKRIASPPNNEKERRRKITG